MVIELKRVQLAASDVPDIYTQVDWPKIIQPKMDGISCVAVNGVAMSRTMKPIPNKQIQEFFANRQLHGLHGELMVEGDFNDVQSFVMSEDKVSDDWYYVVYDWWDSELGYSERYEMLSDFFQKAVSPFKSTIWPLSFFQPDPQEKVFLVPSVETHSSSECQLDLEACIAAGYEGAMLRDPDSLYKQGRHTLKSQGLMKLKKFFDDEAVIIGFEEKMHNENEKTLDERGYSKRSSHKANLVPANTLGALVVKWKDVEFKIGSGYDDAQRKELWNTRDSLIGKPVTFKYQELSKYGIPRFPTIKGLRLEYV